MSDFPTPNNSSDLTGQVALVTGTTSGLGWRFATVLAKAGAKVALTGRRVERLDALAKPPARDAQDTRCSGHVPAIGIERLSKTRTLSHLILCSRGIALR